MGSTRFRLSARGDQWLLRNHAGQRGVPTPSSILATPPRPTAPVHGPPPLPPLRIRQTVGRARETVYARAKTRTACTTTINRPRAIRAPPDTRVSTETENAATSSYHLADHAPFVPSRPPPLPHARAHTVRLVRHRVPFLSFPLSDFFPIAPLNLAPRSFSSCPIALLPPEGGLCQSFWSIIVASRLRRCSRACVCFPLFGIFWKFRGWRIGRLERIGNCFLFSRDLFFFISE